MDYRAAALNDMGVNLNGKKVQGQFSITERRARVAELYRQKMPQAKIAKKLNVAVGTVNKDIQAIRSDWRASAVDDIDERIQEQLRRTEKLYEALQSGISKGSARHVEVALQVLKRQAELVGMDAPKKHEVAGPAGGPIAMQAIPALEDKEIDRILDAARDPLAAELFQAAIGSVGGAAESDGIQNDGVAAIPPRAASGND